MIRLVLKIGKELLEFIEIFNFAVFSGRFRQPFIKVEKKLFPSIIVFKEGFL